MPQKEKTEEAERSKNPFAVFLPFLCLFADFLIRLGNQTAGLLLMVFHAGAKLIKVPLVFLIKLLKSSMRAIKRFALESYRNAVGSDRFFTGRLLKALRRFFTSAVKAPATVPAMLFYYVRRGLEQYKRLLRYLLLLLFPAVACLGLIFTVNYYVNASAGLKITINGKTVGYVTDESVYLTARELALSRLELAPENTKNASELLPRVSYTASLVSVNRFTGAEELCKALLERSETQMVNACGITIDGDFLCAVKNEAEARKVFDLLLINEKNSEPDGTVLPVQDIRYEQGLYPATADTLWDINRLSEVLSALKAEGILTPKTVKTEVYSEEIAFDTVEISSDDLYKGTRRALANGTAGQAQVTATVTYINGEKTDSREVSRLTLLQPVAMRVLVGTKMIDASHGVSYFGGMLMWPAVDAFNINSPYGYRWGKIHRAIDIGSAVGTSLGKPVVAAADGTVITAGVHSSYGYYIKIDHGDGLQTLYAHCQAGSLAVKPGDRVTAGQLIAKIGQTGFATGPHLHFEVIINGVSVNPAPYLGID